MSSGAPTPAVQACWQSFCRARAVSPGQRQCARWGVSFNEQMPVVCQRFELVWPDRPQRG